MSRSPPVLPISPPHRILLHPQARKLAEHRRERAELPDAPVRGRPPLGNAETLRAETNAWSSDVNSTQRGVDWQMKIDDARCKLTSVYPKIKL